jgi:hypothetical protein
MAFSQEPNRTPTSIGNIEVFLSDDGTNKVAEFSIKVLDQNGKVLKTVNGSLIPHLPIGGYSAANLQSFMDAVRIKAIVEIIP